jgi:[NiFe] hydrogenase assembly HybE family chaperone
MTARIARLVEAFEHIGRTRMAGVPVLNAALAVEAVGFAMQTDAAGEHGVLGVLITPWFMNLIWLPSDAPKLTHGVGQTQRHGIGGERFEFIGAHEASVGPYALCSLFSPMFEFADQAAARATAQAVIDTLRAVPVVAPAQTQDPAPMAAPARRSFLFGRSAVA